jgi:hypothetical protein
MEAIHVASAGGKAHLQGVSLLSIGEKLAHRVENSHARGLVQLMSGGVAYMHGHWKNALNYCDQAEKTFQNHCTAVWWELDTAHAFCLYSLFFLGEIAEMTRRSGIYFQEAQERGDLYAMASLGTFAIPRARLAANAPDKAEQELQQIMGQWSQKGFHIQHYNTFSNQVQIKLYCGIGAAAWHCLAEGWSPLAKSLLLRVQFLRIYAWHLRARCALAAAEDPLQRRSLLRVAACDARRLEWEATAYSKAWAQLARAGIATMRDDAGAAISLLRAATSAFEANDMRLYAAAGHRRLGELLGGEEGRVLIVQTDAWMAGQGIVNPGRMTAMLAPGFPKPAS